MMYAVSFVLLSFITCIGAKGRVQKSSKKIILISTYMISIILNPNINVKLEESLAKIISSEGNYPM